MRRYICPVLIGALMVFIFCMSAQPGDESTVTSSRFCVLAARLLFSDFETYTAITQESITEGLTFAVRKAAHFSEYALLGFLWYICLRHKPKNLLTAFLATAGYAVTDEIHQLFVPGRAGVIWDVVIDSSGGLCGILTAFVLLCVLYCLRHREIAPRAVWHSEKEETT